MTIAMIKERLPDFARDTRLNLETVLGPEGAPGLTRQQVAGVALACGYAVENAELAAALQAEMPEVLGPETLEAAKGAASVMAMNNVYYRFLHLAEDKELSKMPARLRMNVIGKPGIPKAEFELMCLAVSALAGCGSCINSHVHEVQKAGITNEGVQSAVRIASVIQAAARSLAIARVG